MLSNQRYINSIYIQTKTINTTQIDIPNIEVFPSDDGLNVPSIETFPIYDDIDIPNIETFPMDESDEMDNIIFIDGTEVVWPSKPHKNGTEGHWEAILEEVNNMVSSGKYTKIYVNKGIGNEIIGAKPNNRPDIMGVREDGMIDQVEVPSKTDSIEKLLDRMEINKEIMGDRAGTSKIKRIKK